MWLHIRDLARAGVVKAAWAVAEGGVAEGLFKMAVGNQIGFRAEPELDSALLFDSRPGSIVAELTGPAEDAVLLGYTTDAQEFQFGGEKAALAELQAVWENGLENVFPTKAGSAGAVEPITFNKRSPLVAKSKFARPRAVITAFPGTNCEYDTARAVQRAGGTPEIVVIKNLTPSLLEESVQAVARTIRESQIAIIPGGFSGGDEPDGSAKFIAAFFRNPLIADAVLDLIRNRDGLMLGICNGFQALIKLGLVPYGEIRPMDEQCPTLTYNLIGRHQSRYVYTRVASVNSPWMSRCSPGDVYAVPISHGKAVLSPPTT
jgi:phosphoribosylformylglycinamidine synthase